MTTAEETLAALDFAPVLRCDNPEHESGLRGCLPGEPAVAHVVVAHHVSGCEPTHALWCAGLLLAQMHIAAHFFAPVNIGTVTITPTATCRRCGTTLTHIDDVIQLIEELQ